MIFRIRFNLLHVTHSSFSMSLEMNGRKKRKNVILSAKKNVYDNFMQLSLIDLSSWSCNFVSKKPAISHHAPRSSNRRPVEK